MDLGHHLPDQVVLAGEVVRDHSRAAQPRLLCDLRERRARVIEFRDRLDRGRHNLLPTRSLVKVSSLDPTLGGTN